MWSTNPQALLDRILPVKQAKGYPDLITRTFLVLFHAQRPEIPIVVLVDFDPDGLNIFRCYRFGAGPVSQDPTAYIPGIRWLGIKSEHVCELRGRLGTAALQRLALNLPQPIVQLPEPVTSIDCHDLSFLTTRDRRHARGTLHRVSRLCLDDEEMLALRRELQVMLMMGVKVEMQWLDDAGDMTAWLERALRAIFS